MNPAKRFKGKSVKAKSGHNDQWDVLPIIQAQFNGNYLTDEFRKSASEAWASASDADVILGQSTVVKKPFSCFQLRDFVCDEDAYLHQLKEELLSLDFNDKSNDLYKFRQSQDLRKVNTPAISALKRFLYSDFRQWISQVTGIKLDSTVDMSCAQYSHTDVLLCHDDELEGRRIAYIFYLVDEDWSAADGGCLDLFDVDANNRPDKIVASIVPRWNSFAFFAVTPTSFHQVSEVLCHNKCRLSVSGWLHGEPLARPPPYVEPFSNITKPGDMDEDEFYSWINPAYLDPSTQGDVQETFGDKSEIQLAEFINPEKYGQLCQALHSLPESTWVDQGPADKRRYQCAVDKEAALDEVRKFFQSEAFYLVLSNMTGLKLHRLAATPSSSDNDSDGEGQAANGNGRADKPKKPKEIDPCCKLQISRWKSGCYTMLSDQDADACQYALDVWLFLSADHWQLAHGGQVSYVARGEDEELLTICPSNNCLALVYRDRETMRFIKHINSLSGELKHFTVNGVYYDQPPSRT